MRASAVGPWVVVVALVLAGCAAQPAGDTASEPNRIKAERKDLSNYTKERPLAALKDIKAFVATAKDGAKLKGHVYIPDGPGPFPTILEYSPYHNSDAVAGGASDNQAQTIDGRRTMKGGFRALMDAGYAVALINLRGSGISQGCFQWGSPVDLEDLYLVLDTLSTAPWSDGQIGMIGTSYPGWTQFMAISNPHPSLKAVIPVSGVIDLHSLLTRNGAPLSIGPAVTTAWEAAFSVAEAAYPPIDSRGGEANHLECGPTYANDIRESLALVTHGDRNAHWDARDLRPKIAQSKIPILILNGLTDGEGHILQFEGLWESIPHQDKRMLLGQWGHGGTRHPNVDFQTIRVAWFDQYLRPASEVLFKPGIVEYQDDARQWHTSETWPPSHNATTVFLSAGSVVADASQVRGSSQTLQSVPENPCPGLCNGETQDLPACGPFQALYVSPPLQEDVLLAGNFHVNITVTSTLPDGNLAVYLYQTKGAGTCPDAGATEIRRALTDLRHAKPNAKGADFPVNVPTRVDIVSHPFAAPVKAGSRIVVAIGGGSTELTPEARLPALTVTTGVSLTGQVTFPVVEGTLAFQ